MMNNYNHAQEKSYNRGDEVFFWFDLDRTLHKVYDRKREKDYFRDNEIFSHIFEAAVNRLEIDEIRDLIADLSVERELKKIADDILIRKINEKLAE
jgi:hypothetical protein